MFPLMMAVQKVLKKIKSKFVFQSFPWKVSEHSKAKLFGLALLKQIPPPKSLKIAVQMGLSLYLAPKSNVCPLRKYVNECKILWNSGNAVWDLLVGCDHSGAWAMSPQSTCWGLWGGLLEQKRILGSCRVQVAPEQRASSLGGTGGTGGSLRSFWRVCS